MKRFYDKNYSGYFYDAVAKRGGQELEIINLSSNSLQKIKDISVKKKENKSKIFPKKNEEKIALLGKTGSSNNINIKTISTTGSVKMSDTLSPRQEQFIKDRNEVKILNSVHSQKNLPTTLNINHVPTNAINNNFENISPINPGESSSELTPQSNFLGSTAPYLFPDKNGFKKEIKEEVNDFSIDEYQQISDKASKLQRENNLLKSTLSEVSRERDFYFSKLRDFEILLHRKEVVVTDLKDMYRIIEEVLYSRFEVELKVNEKGKIFLSKFE